MTNPPNPIKYDSLYPLRDRYHPNKPKESFFVRYFAFMDECRMKEKIPSETYCQRLWKEITGTDPSKADPEFMKDCVDDCAQVVFMESFPD